MRPASPGCTTCSTNARWRAASSVGRGSARQHAPGSSCALVDMLAFGGGQIAQQLADAGIGACAPARARRSGGSPIPSSSACLRTVSRPSGRTSQRGLREEALDVVPADQRDLLAEFFAIEVDQLAAVLVFLLGHFAEDLSGGGEVLAAGPRHSRHKCARAPPRARWRARAAPAPSGCLCAAWQHPSFELLI